MWKFKWKSLKNTIISETLGLSLSDCSIFIVVCVEVIDVKC